MVHPHHCSEPCFVPPHPDLLARTRTQALKAQGTANESLFKTKVQNVMVGERRIPGLNDGMIFPPNHFQKKTSVMAMSKAALERAPLSGSLRYASSLFA
jgi:immune inhibitor A